MKAFRFLTFPAVLLLAAALVYAVDKPAETPPPSKVETPEVAKIAWVSYDEGLKRATTENKYLLVDITASWCGWCKKMDKETFADTAIIKMINEKYIPVKLWGDSDKLLDLNGYKISEKDLVQNKFGPSGYPTFVFMCSDSIGIAKLPGYRGPEDFKNLLTAVNNVSCDSIKAIAEAQKQMK